MKKFNIICALCILAMIGCIIYQIVSLQTGINSTYHLGMLVVDSILLGAVIGECLVGNIMVKYECNFEKENK